MNSYEVSFDYRQLKADMKLDIPELPQLFKDYFGVKVSKSGAYAWFERGKIPLKRLMQLLAIVAFEKDQQLDFWKYVVIDKLSKNKKAA